MLRPNRRQGRLQRRNDRRQARQNAQGLGVISNDILGEDEVEGGKVLAVDGERVVCKRVADLVFDDGVLWV